MRLSLTNLHSRRARFTAGLLAVLGTGLLGARSEPATGAASVPSSANAGVVTAAFAALQDQCDLIQPLFVTARSTGGSRRVDLYSVAPDEFARSLKANTDSERRVASVDLTRTTLTIELGPKAGPGQAARDAGELSASRAVVSAVTYLHSLGYLRDEFHIRVALQDEGDYRVDVVSFPLTPGGHKTIYVTKTNLRMMPGA